jgi:uncharacterized membrane protein YcaP (DUF421 family)
MSIEDLFIRLFGGDVPRSPLGWGHVAMRAVAIYLLSIVVIRVGKSRLLSRFSALDVIIAFILGSLLSRGITGSASISNTAVSSAALIAMHSLLTWLACKSRRIGNLVKGHCRPLVSEGFVNDENLRKSHLSKDDLLEEMRLKANCDDLSKVKAAYKERSGEISVIRRTTTPKILEIDVEEGVKTVRIEWMS